MENMKILLVQCTTILGVAFFDEGWAWINEGQGVHPIAAGFMMCVFLLGPHLLPPLSRLGKRK